MQKNNENNGNIGLVGPYTIVAADALLKVCKAVVSIVLSLDERMSQTNIYCLTECSHQLAYYCLILYFLVRISIDKYTSERAANDSDAK
jgi:hypothetical protein